MFIFRIQSFISREYLTSSFYGLITYYAFPDTWHGNIVLSFLVACFTCLSIALGAYLAGTLGPRQCSFVWPLLGAFLGLPFVFGYRDSSPSLPSVVFLSCCLLEWKIDWDIDYLTSKEQPKFLKRCLIYGAGGLIFGLVLTSAVYQNLQVNINGENVKIKDVLSDFFKSNEFVLIYQQLANIVKQLYGFYLQHGFKGLWTEIWTALDSESDRQAYEVQDLI